MTLFDLVQPARTRRAARVRPGTVTAELPDVCRQYRRAAPWAGIACPAEVLWMPAVATWVRRHGMAIEVRSSAELSLALSSGVAPSRITMHCDGAQAGPIRCGINAGVGVFVVGSNWQADVLAHYAHRPQRVLVDVLTQPIENPVDVVLAAKHLDLVGLHRRVDDTGSYADAVANMVEQMGTVRCERRVLLTRLSLTGAVSASPRRVGEAVDDALDDACARFRHPRPGVTLSLLWPVRRAA